MKNTIEDPLCMNYNSAGVLMSNKDIPKELRSVSLVDLSVALELQDELNKCNHTLTEQGKMYNELRQEKESIQHHRDELHDENEVNKSLLKEAGTRVINYDIALNKARAELTEQKKLTDELAAAITELKTESLSLMELCVDRGILNGEEDNQGEIDFNEAITECDDVLTKYQQSLKNK